MDIPITTWATIALAAIYIALTVRVVGARRSAGVSLGDGGDATLSRRMRGQANFIENVPITLLLIAVAELQTVSLWPGFISTLLALLALAFVVGRLLHGIAFAYTDKWVLGRMLGMVLSLFSTVALFFLALLSTIF